MATMTPVLTIADGAPTVGAYAPFMWTTDTGPNETMDYLIRAAGDWRVARAVP